MTKLIENTKAMSKEVVELEAKVKAKTKELLVNIAYKVKDSVSQNSKQNHEVSYDWTMNYKSNTALKNFASCYNNKLKYGSLRLAQYNIKFTPEHKWLEVRMQHQLTAYSFYSKKKDKTYLFITDHGYIDWTDVFGNAHQTGTTIVFDGYVDFDKFAETDNYISLLTHLYHEKDAEMAKDREAKEAVA